MPGIRMSSRMQPGSRSGADLQKLDAAFIGPHVKARGLEHEPDRAADRVVVIDQMDQPQLFVAHVFASPDGSVK